MHACEKDTTELNTCSNVQRWPSSICDTSGSASASETSNMATILVPARFRSRTQEDRYQIVKCPQTGKTVFACSICQRHLSSKQRIYCHLSSNHGENTPARATKRYLDDPTLSIPKRTQYRHAKLNVQANDDNKEDNGRYVPERSSPVTDQFAATPDDYRQAAGGVGEEHGRHAKERSTGADQYTATADASKHVEPSQCDSASSSASDLDETDSLSLSSSGSDSSTSSEDSDDCGSTDSGDIGQVDQHDIEKLSEKESQMLCIVAYLLRHKVSGLESKDLLLLMQTVCPGFNMKPSELWTYAAQYGSVNEDVYHFCNICNAVFPQDKDVVSCGTNGCDGLRYHGSRSRQMKKERKARKRFVIADIEKQLRALFGKKTIWENLKKENNSNGGLQDVCDGLMCRKLREPGGFLAEENHFSAIFNTDGIPLYSSTGEKLWPIFLCINEIPVEQRFARENTVLVGIWQGKGSPPFQTYMAAFSKKMVDLYNNGFEMCPPVPTGEENTSEIMPVCVKVAVLLGTVDLQAKAYCTNMTQHNGEYGCITCEEVGEVVRQGKGHSRCYPYRPPGEHRSLRQSEEILDKFVVEATRSRRVKGFCGKSGLEELHQTGFDLVLSMMPDYMHGVLMGVTARLHYRHQKILKLGVSEAWQFFASNATNNQSHESPAPDIQSNSNVKTK